MSSVPGPVDQVVPRLGQRCDAAVKTLPALRVPDIFRVWPGSLSTRELARAIHLTDEARAIVGRELMFDRDG